MKNRAIYFIILLAIEVQVLGLFRIMNNNYVYFDMNNFSNARIIVTQNNVLLYQTEGEISIKETKDKLGIVVKNANGTYSKTIITLNDDVVYMIETIILEDGNGFEKLQIQMENM